MSLFDFKDYREFLVKRNLHLPKKGRGEMQKIATALGIHTSTMSQVVSGQKCFTPEQGSKLAQYLGLGELESDYLLTLIDLERAGTPDLRERLEKRLAKIQKQSQELIHRLPTDRVLSEEDKAVFYSNWFYSAIRLSTEIKGLQTTESLAEFFELSPSLVNEVMRFLISCGLCVEENGLYKIGPQRTHLEASSPLISRHHVNWRLKAVERAEAIEPSEEIQFSSPLVLSKADAIRIRTLLLDEIQSVMKIVTPSPSETLYCFNLDWIKIK